MAPRSQLIISALVIAVVLAIFELSAAQLLKAKVSCLDCDYNHNLSGIKILVKCDKVKKFAMATTKDDGSFEIEIPSDNLRITKGSLMSCNAKLHGGPKQLFASKKLMQSNVVKTQDPTTYTSSTILAFYTSCPSTLKQYEKYCSAMKKLGSSKTVDLPVPPEWGLAPTSYYVPYFPIIGIP